MRTLMAITAAALVAAVVVLVWMTNQGTPSRQAQAPESTEAAPTEIETQTPAEATSVLPSPRKPSLTPRSSAEATNRLQDLAPGTAAAQHEAEIEKRVLELQDLGMENDPESLRTILAELHNEDRSIREAAVEAAIQFGSRDAIPELTQAAAQTTDPDEKAAILDAIDFLKLPTLSEVLAQTNQPAANASPGAGPRR